MKSVLLKLALPLALALPAAVLAHHSFTALYFLDQEQEIEGQVVQFAVRNPHSFLHVAAPDENGDVQRWAIEWGGIASLGRINRETLKPGDRVTVVGNPSRDPEAHRLRMRSIVRPSDGWSWSGDFD